MLKVGDDLPCLSDDKRRRIAKVVDMSTTFLIMIIDPFWLDQLNVNSFYIISQASLGFDGVMVLSETSNV